jgi:hypothetical protein
MSGMSQSVSGPFRRNEGGNVKIAMREHSCEAATRSESSVWRKPHGEDAIVLAKLRGMEFVRLAQGVPLALPVFNNRTGGASGTQRSELSVQ